ncbi:hypothetical protein KIW84_056119 [Lathyrus oleraceus]|uniref:Uncharacterized protein n=1 Tax=Pisum sativum TaxID=3888 RepID=A0A9D4X277_PEA|nr:hypothetical protein KIW84_056119 [Pisum sativum]
MTAKEKTTFCSVLKNAKIPDGCASNISRYFHSGVETRFTRITRNSDICDPHERESSSSCLNVGHPIGGKRKGEAISLDCKSRSLAHCYILFNHEDVQKFIREHENKNPNKRKGSKAKSQGLDFVEWFKKRALLSDVSENLRKLSRGPNESKGSYPEEVINVKVMKIKNLQRRLKCSLLLDKVEKERSWIKKLTMQ